MMKIIVLILFAGGVVLGCKHKDVIPQDVLQPEEMKKVVWDVLTAEALAREMANKDTTVMLSDKTKRLSGEVFKSYGLTEDSFFKSYNWYAAHPDVFGALLDSLYEHKSRDQSPSAAPAADKKKTELKRIEPVKIKRPGEEGN